MAHRQPGKVEIRNTGDHCMRITGENKDVWILSALRDWVSLGDSCIDGLWIQGRFKHLMTAGTKNVNTVPFIHAVECQQIIVIEEKEHKQKRGFKFEERKISS